MEFPSYKIFAANGTTEIYHFKNVIDDGGLFDNPQTFVEHQSLRGRGGIISKGGKLPFDINLSFILVGQGQDASDKYEDLFEQMEKLGTTIAFDTKYILKVEKTPSSTRNIKVKRLFDIVWPNNRRTKRIILQDGQILFRGNVWE